MVTKKKFYERKSIRNLSSAEKAKRWKQHQSNANTSRKRPAQQSKKAPRQAPVDACLSDYAKSSLAPWNEITPCVPRFPGLPSLKQKFFVRGTMNTGTAGVGFVMAMPWASNQDLSTTSGACRYSTSTYATSFLNYNSGLGGTNAAFLNSPYTNAEFDGESLSCRIVSAGIRIKYIGTVLDKGGVIYAVQQPDHESLDGKSVESLSAYDKVRAISVGNEWVGVTYTPIRAEELEYNDNPYPKSVKDYLAIVAVAPDPAKTLPFAFEYYVNVELIGSGARGKTPTPVSSQTETIMSQIASVANTASQAVKASGVTLGQTLQVLNYGMNHLAGRRGEVVRA